MTEPDYLITLPDGTQYINVTIAARMLGVNRRRILFYVERGMLSARNLPRSKELIIPFKEFRKFAATPRSTGRPKKKSRAGKKARGAK